jgi:hypothetical protein
MRWPRLIGLAVGLLGLGAMLSWIPDQIPYGFPSGWTFVAVTDFAARIGVTLFPLLSVPLFMARDWAKRRCW